MACCTRISRHAIFQPCRFLNGIGQCRSFYSATGKGNALIRRNPIIKNGWRIVGCFSGTVAFSFGLGCFVKQRENYDNTSLWSVVTKFVPVARAAAPVGAPAVQDNVVSQTKNHALYLWIHLKTGADCKQCVRPIVDLQKLVDEVCPPDLRDEADEIWAGIGFGPALYTSLGKSAPKDYKYHARKGNLGELPDTGGDIFIHAKSNSLGNLFDLCQQIHKRLPPECVQKFSDTYSFVYRNGRDLSGFIDGTENPADDEKRHLVAVDAKSGGSFCITQKWVHDHNTISGQKTETLEGWIGRNFSDSTELKKKPTTSHVARMTSGPEFGAKKPHEIVRQSMPYGTVSGESGLFFIGFAASPDNFEYMLDRMTGAAKDGLCDDVMRLSRCTQGTYWYFPSKEELKSLAA